MALDSEKLRAKMEREKQKALLQSRKLQGLAAKLSQASRAEDNHRKILDGVTAAYGCKVSEEYRKLHERFRDQVLYLPKDRAAFGLPLLPDAEVERRANAAAKGKSRRAETAPEEATRVAPDAPALPLTLVASH